MAELESGQEGHPFFLSSMSSAVSPFVLISLMGAITRQNSAAERVRDSLLNRHCLPFTPCLLSLALSHLRTGFRTQQTNFGYTSDEARRVAGAMLPEIMPYDCTRPVKYPDNGRFLTRR